MLLRRSIKRVFRQRPERRPIRSLVPTDRNAHEVWRAMLASFSTKIIAWRVQISADSDAEIKDSRRNKG